MDIRVLKYFLAVAREETISGAAESLHMTQPPLSKQLKALENQLGKQLFIRGKRKIILTKEGMILKERAEEIIALLEKTKEEISKADGSIRGEVHIGVGETKSMRFIAQIVKELQAQYPKIRCNISSGDNCDVRDLHEKGIIDFGTLLEPIDKNKYDYLKLPQSNTWGLLMRKDNPIAQLESIDPETLKQTPLICPRQSIIENTLSKWLGHDCETLNIVSTHSLSSTPSPMVEEGVGCSLTLNELLDLADDSPLCFRPLEPKLEASLFIVWKKHQIFSNAAEIFFSILKEHLERAEAL